MPIKKVKSKKSISNSNPNSNSNSNLHKHQSILDIIKSFASRNNISKSKNNLPARLMQMKSYKALRSQPNTKPQVFSKSFTKSSSSSFSSVMKNGKVQTHSEGKEIINNSNRPFIEIKEMENGDVSHYIVPKKTIPYVNKNKNMNMNMNMNKSRILSTLNLQPSTNTKISKQTKTSKKTKTSKQIKRPKNTKKSTPKKKTPSKKNKITKNKKYISSK